jgi:hypothetical protein
MDDRGTTSLVGINLAWSERALDRSRPLCTLVRIAFRDPGDDAMGSSGERDEIARVENALAARVDREVDAAHVLSVRGDGAIQFWAYSSAAAQHAVHAAARDLFKNWDVKVTSKPDSAWDVYTNLLPDAQTMREIADLQLVDLLESKGDALTTPRPVEHFVFFPSRAAAERFGREARAYGFEVALDDGETTRPAVAVVTREDPVDFESIHEVTTLLSELADAQGGEYDGWETRVVPK